MADLLIQIEIDEDGDYAVYTDGTWATYYDTPEEVGRVVTEHLRELEEVNK